MTATATTVKPITAKQSDMIADLTASLGMEDFVMPRTSRSAFRFIFKLRAMAREANGGHDAPTPAQLRLLEQLGDERGRVYATPKTRKQATAKIAQILAAAAKPTGAAAEPLAA